MGVPNEAKGSELANSTPLRAMSVVGHHGPMTVEPVNPTGPTWRWCPPPGWPAPPPGWAPTAQWLPDPAWPSPPPSWDWWHTDPPLDEARCEAAGRRLMELDAEQAKPLNGFEFTEPDAPMIWVAPPGWPRAPRGWHPPATWAPDRRWPAPPAEWQFWQKDPAVVEGARTRWWAQIVQASLERISAPEFVFWELRRLEEQLLTTVITTARVLEVDAWATQADAVMPWDAPERRAVLAAQMQHLQALADQRSFLTRTTAAPRYGEAYARVRFTTYHADAAVTDAIGTWTRAVADLYRTRGGLKPNQYVERLKLRWLNAFKEARRVDALLAFQGVGTDSEPPPGPLSEVAAWEAAEQVAALALQAMGFRDAAVTSTGADGGLDVEGRGVAAQVKYLTRPVGRPELQRLAGANQHGAQAVFFSRAGYAAGAVAYADTIGMALFILKLPDDVQPVNHRARGLIAAVEDN